MEQTNSTDDTARYVSATVAARMSGLSRQRIHQLLATPGAIPGAIAIDRGPSGGRERKVWAIPVASVPKRKNRTKGENP